MSTFNYRFTLEIQSTMSQASLPVRRGDTNRSLYITLTDGGSPYIIPRGYTAVLVGKKADGATISRSCIIEKDSIVRYDFTEQTSNVSGIVDCEIRVYAPVGEGEKPNMVTSPKFVMVVDERVVLDDDIAPSEDQMKTFDEIVTEEQRRKLAEESRFLAEEERMAAEAARNDAENLRVSAEVLREDAEELRVSAEAAREEAEVERNAELKRLSDEFRDALDLKRTRVVDVSIPAASWQGGASPYSQVVTIAGVTPYSKVDLQPSPEQLAVFHNKDLAFVTENDDGVVTVYAIGDKPTQDYIIQASVKEVEA